MSPLLRDSCVNLMRSGGHGALWDCFAASTTQNGFWCRLCGNIQKCRLASRRHERKKRTFGKMAFLERSRGLSERRPGFFAESNQSALLESLKKWGQIAESFPLLNSFWRCCLFFSKNVYVLLLLCLFIFLWPLTTTIWQFS